MDRIERETIFHNAAILNDVRRPTGKYYAVTGASRAVYLSMLKQLAVAHDVLEIGCSTGKEAIELARLGARVSGVDVATLALDQANQRARDAGLSVDFRLANAEQLPFEDGHFDLVYGTGILHHLDLKLISTEIARVLRPEGSAVFYEPLGHNLFINLYRKLTPKLRSADEHPLLISDVEFICSFFRRCEVHYFHMSSLAAVPLRNTALFHPAVATLERLDAALFRAVPYSRRFAWMVVIVMREPIASRAPARAA